jgi:hypothetical protein
MEATVREKGWRVKGSRAELFLNCQAIEFKGFNGTSEPSMLKSQNLWKQVPAHEFGLF